MKKLVTFVFAAVLSLAVLNVMASDKTSKKTKASKKVNTVKAVSQNNLPKTVKTPDGKVRTVKAIKLSDLKKLKQ